MHAQSEKAVSDLLSSKCLFYGCLCNNNDIICPSTDSTSKFTMFPKRHLLVNFLSSRSRISLDLSFNFLESIPDDRFAFINFIKVNISNNHLYRLSPDAFRDIIRLDILDLSNNRIDYINIETFKPLVKSLNTFFIQFNQLVNMEASRLSNILNELKNLKILDLSHNRLMYLPRMNSMSFLTHLNLESNRLEFLTGSDSNEQLLPNSLINLNIQHNELKYLNENSFGLLTKLKYLNLAHNQISEIAENTFIHLISLIELDLSYNFLKHIPSRIFYTLVRLDRLDLSTQKIPIKSIDNYAFDRKSNEHLISLISLKNNKISIINERAFCSNDQLHPYISIKEIDLSSNSLTKLNVCTIRQLYLGHQAFYNESKVIIKTFQSNDSTTIECDCQITKASKVLNL
jgi:Leucine-rich repeat (LRR) protein